MEDKNDKKQSESKSRSELFWEILITGGWSSFEKEWKSSKSSLHTILMLVIPILLTGVIVLLAILANNIFD